MDNWHFSVSQVKTSHISYCQPHITFTGYLHTAYKIIKRAAFGVCKVEWNVAYNVTFF